MLVTDLSSIESSPSPCSLTIGSFDGLHRGHKKILDRITEYPVSALLTFKNHPAEILPGRSAPPLLCSLEHKIDLLKNTGLNRLILIPFTKQLSIMSYADFLKLVHKSYPFSLLVLGDGARLGKNREGTPERIKALGSKLNFTVEYISTQMHKGSPISSGRIRTLILEGNLLEAAELLGKPYSIYGTLHNNTLDLHGLCHPPSGTYSVRINNHKTKILIEKDTLSILSSPLPDASTHIFF